MEAIKTSNTQNYFTYTTNMGIL